MAVVALVLSAKWLGLFDPSPTTIDSSEIWKTQTVAGLSVDLPFSLQPMSNPLESAPKEVRDVIAESSTYEGGDPNRTKYGVALSSIKYLDSVMVSLDGAAAGSISSAAKAAGDDTPKYSITEADRGEFPARRAAYLHPANKLRIEGFYIQDGQRIAAVTIYYDPRAAYLDVDRIINSVRIAHEE